MKKPTNKQMVAGIGAAKKIMPCVSSSRRMGENGLRNADEFVEAILCAALNVPNENPKKIKGQPTPQKRPPRPPRK